MTKKGFRYFANICRIPGSKTMGNRLFYLNFKPSGHLKPKFARVLNDGSFTVSLTVIFPSPSEATHKAPFQN